MEKGDGMESGNCNVGRKYGKERMEMGDGKDDEEGCECECECE